MSVTKIVTLVIYAVLAFLAFTQGDTTVGIWSLRLLGILVVVHLIETVVFFKLCQSAGGSLRCSCRAAHSFQVFHVNEIKAAQGKT